MTTDTEALRAKFETTIAAIYGGRPYVLDCRLDNGAYAAKDFQTAWRCYQAGHAAAKAETAAAVAADSASGPICGRLKPSSAPRRPR